MDTLLNFHDCSMSTNGFTFQFISNWYFLSLVALMSEVCWNMFDLKSIAGSTLWPRKVLALTSPLTWSPAAMYQVWWGVPNEGKQQNGWVPLEFWLKPL